MNMNEIYELLKPHHRREVLGALNNLKEFYELLPESIKVDRDSKQFILEMISIIINKKLKKIKY